MTSMLQSRALSLPGTPRKPTTTHQEEEEEDDVQVPLTPHRPSVDNYIYAPRRNSSVITRELREFDYKCVQFRTPQCAVRGTNKWGGASPLLSANVPIESLELEYLKFAELCTGEYEEAAGGGGGRMKRRFWGFRKFWWRRKVVEREVVLGSSGRSRRRGWMSKKWPQGW